MQKCPGVPVVIDTPTYGTTIEYGKNGVNLTGTVCLNTGEVLYAFDSSGSIPDEPPYTMDTPAWGDSAGPIATVSGPLSYLDQPIGDNDGGTGQPTTVITVVANTHCQKVLNAIPPDSDGNFVVNGSWPAGCTRASDVVIYVTHPGDGSS